jgi:hypothetical protein
VGDGKFTNISWRFPWRICGIPIPGYTIEFDHFDLSTEREVSYHLEKLPLVRSEVGVYLCLNDSQHLWQTDESHTQLKGRVELEVTDELGKSVCRVNQPLAKLIWAYPEGGPETYGLYKLQESFFPAVRNKKYRIHVHYSPDPSLKGVEGFVFIRCGGSV